MMLRWLARSACSMPGTLAPLRRGVGRRDRGGDIRQDRLNMTERGAGILPRIELGEQAVLQGGEIVGLGRDAAKSRLTCFDAVLPESAHRRPHRIVEGRAEDREDQGRSRSRAHGWSAAFRRYTVTAGGEFGATVVLVASSAGESRSASRRYSLSAEPAIFRPLLFTQVHERMGTIVRQGAGCCACSRIV